MIGSAGYAGVFNIVFFDGVEAGGYGKTQPRGTSQQQETATMSDPTMCDLDVFAHGEVICIVDMPAYEAEAICARKSSETGDRYDWHYSGGRVVMKKLPAGWVKPESVESLKQHIAELESKLAAAEADALRRLKELFLYELHNVDTEVFPDLEDALNLADDEILRCLNSAIDSARCEKS